MPRSLTQRLRAIAVSLSLLLGLGRLPMAASAQGVPVEVIGYSQGGMPLEVYHVKPGPVRMFILGGQHGGPEVNTVELAGGLLEYFVVHPDEIPPRVGLDILVNANPDGVARNSRQFLSGVDPNRNWGGAGWQSDAWDSNAVFRVGLGGPEPFSEPETRVLGNYLLANKPAMVINYHSQGNFMFGAGRTGAAYQQATGYYWPTGGAPSGGRSGGSPLPYRATGSMNPWLRTEGMDNILVELATSRTSEFERNLAGVRAVLEVLADPGS